MKRLLVDARIVWDPQCARWRASIADLPGCEAHGDTPVDALVAVHDVARRRVEPRRSPTEAAAGPQCG